MAVVTGGYGLGEEGQLVAFGMGLGFGAAPPDEDDDNGTAARAVWSVIPWNRPLPDWLKIRQDEEELLLILT